MVVVHVPPDKTSMLAQLFGDKCDMNVTEAEDKEPIRPGTVYFAPPGYHLQVEPDKTLSLSGDPPVLYSRPSVDVLFESAADAYGESLVAIVLTGANHDGACGLKTVADAGGVTIVQAPSEAQAPAMPSAALALSPTARVLPLAEIARYLRRIEKV
jgi:two-component system chemotaxis response regulator CheB